MVLKKIITSQILWTEILSFIFAAGVPLGYYTWYGISIISGVCFISKTIIWHKFLKAKPEHKICCINTLLKLLYQRLNPSSDDSLRCTLFELRKQPTKQARDASRLYQIARFDNIDNKISNTSIDHRQGVAGLLLRKGQTRDYFKDSFYAPIIKDFIEEMISWGFTQDEANKLKPCRCYLCFLILDANRKVLGLLSLDSEKEKHFEPEAEERIIKELIPHFIKALTD